MFNPSRGEAESLYSLLWKLEGGRKWDSASAVLTFHNRPYQCSRYWTGTSLQLRLILMRGIVSNANSIYPFLMIFPRHEPPLQASSSPIQRIRIWSIGGKWYYLARIATNDHFFPLFPAEQKACTVCVIFYSYKARVKQFCQHWGSR